MENYPTIYSYFFKENIKKEMEITISHLEKDVSEKKV